MSSKPAFSTFCFAVAWGVGGDGYFKRGVCFWWGGGGGGGGWWGAGPIKWRVYCVAGTAFSI